MAKNSLAIIGKSPLAGELAELAREKGWKANLYPDARRVAAATPLVIDTLLGEEEKRQSLKKLDSVLPASSVVLTSSLGFPVSHIASWSKRPERVVGFATFYPLKEKKVVELTLGLKTEEKAAQQAEGFFRSLGKETVRVRDGAGLIFPRIVSLIINEASRSFDEGVAEAEEIDTAMRLGVNYPSGPLRWADRVGLDEVLAVLEGLQRETGDDRYRPAPLIKKMVMAGWLGEKSGRGFYLYDDKKEGKVKK